MKSSGLGRAAGPSKSAGDTGSNSLPQYSYRRILGTWAAAALPMAALAWVGAPALAPTFDGDSAWPRAILLCLTAGMIWQVIDNRTNHVTAFNHEGALARQPNRCVVTQTCYQQGHFRSAPRSIHQDHR